MRAISLPLSDKGDSEVTTPRCGSSVAKEVASLVVTVGAKAVARWATADSCLWAIVASDEHYPARPRSGRPLFGEALARERARAVAATSVPARRTPR